MVSENIGASDAVVITLKKAVPTGNTLFLGIFIALLILGVLSIWLLEKRKEKNLAQTNMPDYYSAIKSKIEEDE